MELMEVVQRQINTILNDLTTHEISKNEASERLIMLLLSKGAPAEKDALNAAVSAVYFRDSSDYLSYHFSVISNLTGLKEEQLTDSRITALFKELNPDTTQATA